MYPLEAQPKRRVIHYNLKNVEDFFGCNNIL